MGEEHGPQSVIVVGFPKNVVVFNVHASGPRGQMGGGKTAVATPAESAMTTANIERILASEFGVFASCSLTNLLYI